MFQAIDGMATTNSYNIWRYNHPEECLKHFSKIKYQLQLIEGMIQYSNGNELEVARAQAAANSKKRNIITSNIISTSHQIQEFEEKDHRNRIIRRVCKHCSDIKAYPDSKAMKRTKMFCTKCDVPLHPQCFTAYHSTNNISITANQVDIYNVTNTPINPGKSASRFTSRKRTRTS
jgi:hypothetical protein